MKVELFNELVDPWRNLELPITTSINSHFILSQDVASNMGDMGIYKTESEWARPPRLG
jgi:hypothetical protein